MTGTKNQPSRLKAFWRNQVVALLVAQLKQGITPEKIALSVALGITLGIFPIIGSTTILCAAAGWWLKLNQPIIQFVNYVMYPVQLLLILVFVRLGEWIVRAKRMPFSIPELIHKFQVSPKQFMQAFGMTAVHGIIGWTILAPVAALLIYFGLLSAVRKLGPGAT